MPSHHVLGQQVRELILGSTVHEMLARVLPSCKVVYLMGVQASSSQVTNHNDWIVFCDKEIYEIMDKAD